MSVLKTVSNKKMLSLTRDLSSTLVASGIYKFRKPQISIVDRFS